MKRSLITILTLATLFTHNAMAFDFGSVMQAVQRAVSAVQPQT